MALEATVRGVSTALDDSTTGAGGESVALGGSTTVGAVGLEVTAVRIDVTTAGCQTEPTMTRAAAPPKREIAKSLITKESALFVTVPVVAAAVILVAAVVSAPARPSALRVCERASEGARSRRDAASREISSAVAPSSGHRRRSLTVHLFLSLDSRE